MSATFGSNYPAAGYSDMAAFWMEFILTLGLVSVILGTASGAQNIGIVGAFGVGGYIALAGLWGSPISGTSMNPARTFGPDLVGARLDGLLGVRRRTDRRRRGGGASSGSCCAVAAAEPPDRARPRAPRHRGRHPREGLIARPLIARMRWTTWWWSCHACG